LIATSIVLSASWYVTVTPDSVLLENIAPVVSDITSDKATPATVIASASSVPSKSPSTASMLPLNIVAVTVPVLGL